jgi:leader peptidase (prepilin peptidase)/N-methyltransferase
LPAEVVAGGVVGAAVAAGTALLVRRRYPAGAGPSGFDDRPPGALPLLPLGALLGGLLGAGLAMTAAGVMEAGAVAAFTALLVVLALMDVERGLLPDMVTLPGCIMALALSPWLAGGFREAIAGGAVGFLVTLVIYLLPVGYLGAGDVKLGALLGFGLGYPRALDGLLAGVVLGGVGALAYLLWPAQEARAGGWLRRIWQRRKGVMPYGPFLAAGGVLVLLGERLWQL